MSRKLLDYDALSGVATWHDYDESTGRSYIQEEQKCGRFVESAKQLARADREGYGARKDDFRHVARVPVTILYKWLKEHNLDYNRKEDLPKIMKLLQSNEYKYLRTVDKI